jgi:oligopeptide/dipeptide ABC transporter ATP-binding protein
MQQRIMIAIALACKPRLLLADEPTTALDVTIQAQVLDLMEDINREMGTAIVIVTHDLALAGDFCDNIAVMYAGKIVEYGSVYDVYGSPVHPYAMGLVESFPNIHAERSAVRSLPGFPPNLLAPPSGCRFHPRCPIADEECMQKEPLLREIANTGHMAACHKAEIVQQGVDIWAQ